MNLITNTSGVEPRGRAVLIEHYNPEVKESPIFIPEAIKDKVNAVEQRARVIAIGRACWPDEPRRAEVGEYVLVSKFAGYELKGPRDGKSYRLINDRDIFAVITHVEV